MSFSNNSEAEIESHPFVELNHTVKVWIWITAIFGVVVTVLALAAISLAWYGLRQQLTQTEETVIALCRQTNEHNKELRIIFLSLGVHAHDLADLRPKPCDAAQLRKDFIR